MSPAWRKQVSFQRGETLLGTAHIMLKGEDGGIPTCGVCPCVGGWYIATLCPCSECGGPVQRYVGDYDAVFPVGHSQEGDPIEDANGVQIRKMVLSRTFPQDGVYVMAGAKLYAIEHLTDAAPFDAYATLTVWLGHGDDKVELVSVSAQEIDEGQQAYVGWNYFGDDDADENKTGLVKLAQAFSDGGVYEINARLTFTNRTDSSETASYEMQRVVVVGEWPHETPTLGQVAIVPAWAVDEAAGCAVEGTLYGDPIWYTLTALKGAFYKRSEAEQAYCLFADLIAAYAATCACGEYSPGGDPICAETDSIGPGAGTWEVYDPGFAGCEVGPGGGGDNWTFFSGWGATLTGSGFSVRLEVMDGNGNWSTLAEIAAPGNDDVTGLIQPCGASRVMINRSGTASGGLAMGGESGAVGRSIPCVLVDEESEFFEAAWDYDMDTHEGVPGNSAELADYLEHEAV